MGRGTLWKRGIEGHCRGRGTLYVLIYHTWRAMQTCKLRFLGGIVLFFLAFLKATHTAAVRIRCLFFSAPREA